MGDITHQSQTIMVVDDEEDVLQLMKLSLRAKGFGVSVCPNGDNLFDLLLDQPPDLILLDVHMNGVDGGTVCHLLKHSSSTSKIPILIFSANDDIVAIAKDCGADGCIKKPFSPEKLKTELTRILGKPVN